MIMSVRKQLFLCVAVVLFFVPFPAFAQDVPLNTLEGQAHIMRLHDAAWAVKFERTCIEQYGQVSMCLHP